MTDWVLPGVPPSLVAPLLQGIGEALREMKAQDVPPSVRPLLGFDRRGFASASARTQLERALEAEADFRQEVFDAFAERPDVQAVLGEWDPAKAVPVVSAAAGRDDLAVLASALVAAQPDGWEFGLGIIVALHERQVDEAARDDDRRAFAVQVEKAEEARRRAEGEARELRRAVERLTDELRSERADRRSREEAVRSEADEVMARVERLESKLAQAEQLRERAEERARNDAERATGLEERLAEAHTEATRERAEAARARADAERASEVARRAAERLPADFAGLSRHEIEALRRLAEGQAVGEGPVGEPTPPPAPSVAPPPAHVDADHARARKGPRRRVSLPPGVVGPSLEGLRAALETSGPDDPAVIVDGYNVSMQAWGDAAPDTQRQRLCALLERLHVRTNRSVTVVFDGADVEGLRPPRRPGVRVVFSPADVEADELVVAEVEHLPPERPAVVVSSDRWVQDHAEAEGALVVRSELFLEYLRK